MRARYMFAFVACAVLTLGVATARAADGPLVEVPLDIDVYAEPGGVGEPVAMIKGGTQVSLATEDDHWCNVYGPNVPGGKGWIWCGMGDDKQNYAVKPVVAEKPAEPDKGGGTAAPVKSDCKTIGPNEEAGGGSSDPKVTYKCVDVGDGTRECCFYTQP